MLRCQKMLAGFRLGLFVGAFAVLLSGRAGADEPSPAVVALEKSFHSRDKDGDGKLSLEEYLAGTDKAGQKLAQRNFKVVDFDSDGKLTFEEFKALPGLLPVAERGAVPDLLADLAAAALATWRNLSQEFDANGDGKLSLREWPGSALRTQLGPLGNVDFTVWDGDGNDLVDDAEAETLIAAAFGTRLFDGMPLRRSNGSVLFSSWIRRADTDRDQIISRAEFMQGYWRTPDERGQCFADLDGDQDGLLTYTELWRDPGLNIDVMSLFFAYDRDLDGVLSLAEMQLNASTGATEAQMRQSLEACGDDHDGKLSLREYQLAPAGIGYITLELFGRGDRNNDGYLDWNEFYTEQSPLLIGLAWDLFRRFDRDHDGRLGLDEFQFAVDRSRVPLPVVFRTKDRDHDGRLQFGEVFSAAKPAAGNPLDLERYQIRLTRAQERFKGDDADRDGALDLDEFTRGRKADAEREKEEYSTRLFIADSDGSNMKQLTDLPGFQKQGSPAWSQDGKYIAFDGWKAGQGFGGSQIVVVQADGRNPRVLGPGAMPCFSPGGQRIAFSKPGSGTWIMSSQGPDEELVQLDPQGWGTDWSPQRQDRLCAHHRRRRQPRRLRFR
jgi:Ca2+-binding EF-hand superfamily protein